MLLTAGVFAETKIIDVSTAKAKALLHSDDAPMVIDVRTPVEFKSGHVNGAKNINYRSLNFKKRLSKLDKNQVYLVHCKSGGRSSRSLKVFKELGFAKVYHLKSGYQSWK